MPARVSARVPNCVSHVQHHTLTHTRTPADLRVFFLVRSTNEHQHRHDRHVRACMRAKYSCHPQTQHNTLGPRPRALQCTTARLLRALLMAPFGRTLCACACTDCSIGSLGGRLIDWFEYGWWSIEYLCHTNRFVYVLVYVDHSQTKGLSRKIVLLRAQPST